MGLMSRNEAIKEADARFPGDFTKQNDFLNSWYGLYWRKNRCREKIRDRFGNGRRRRRNRKPETDRPKNDELIMRLSFWQMLKIRIILFFGRLKRKFSK